MKVTQYGAKFVPGTDGTPHESLPVGIYTYQISPKGEQYLEMVSAKFQLPAKLYLANDDILLHHLIENSWADTKNSNLGILLQGEKGQGKTLLAKKISNELEVPVIMLVNPIPISFDFMSFIHSFDCDMIVLIDEFEKTFKSNNDGEGFHTQESFLSFLSGVFTSNYRKLFIMTSNSAVNQYLKNRPSRVKFFRNYYNGVEEKLAMEIIEDMLVKDEDLKKDLINSLDFGQLNVDVLIQIINEINTQRIPYSKFKHLFNFTPTVQLYNVVFTSKGVPVKGCKVALPTINFEGIASISLNKIFKEITGSSEHLDLRTFNAVPKWSSYGEGTFDFPVSTYLTKRTLEWYGVKTIEELEPEDQAIWKLTEEIHSWNVDGLSISLSYDNAPFDLARFGKKESTVSTKLTL